jgi:hypothetical protein
MGSIMCLVHASLRKLCLLFLYSDIDDCSGAPCENGGTCTDDVNSYSCACAVGFTGNNCQTGKSVNVFLVGIKATYNFMTKLMC